VVVIQPGYTTSTEEYDGTSWTSNPTGMSTGRKVWQEQGVKLSALAFGGQGPTPTRQALTEEWTWCRSTINSYNHSFLTLYLFI
jgi:hypothetical protein